MFRISPVLLSLLLACPIALLSCRSSPSPGNATVRPNILLLVADDLGYADLGCYGSDIETPNIDRLAENGIRFSRFHTSPKCAPTRAMLLSGNDNHIAGMGRQGLRTGEFGYEGMLTDRIVPMPALLRDAGYLTCMAGKWHLGTSPEADPHRKGFDHSFALLEGAGNHYSDRGLFESAPVSPYTEDGKEAGWPEGAYSTDLYTDKILSYIDLSRQCNQPFFIFAAFTSPHWPLQVDEAFWRKYEGRFDGGYEQLKSRRMESLKRAGMIPEDAVLPPDHESVRSWSELSAEEQRKEARKMELYAGMVDNLDHNIGRILRHLEETGELERTFILFMSDNGAANEDFYYDEHYGPFLRQHYSDEYESMGQALSFISYGPQWAEAGSAPFRYFKGFTTEGGMVAPMIISGPGVPGGNLIHHGFVTLLDIAPTFYELAGTGYPESYGNIPVRPLKGTSMLPLLRGETDRLHAPDEVFAIEHGNRAMVRKGPWKITSIDLPFHPDNFHLYKVESDLAEMNDLKEEEPEIYWDLITTWETYAREAGVQVPPPRAE